MHPASDNRLMAIDGLSRRFSSGGPAAVGGIDFHVDRGEILALIGPSGCGKTTTLRMIAGFEKADSGRITLGGREITNDAPEARGIGFVFQDFALFPHLDVAANVGFGLHGKSRAAKRQRIQEMLDMVALSAFKSRSPFQLSGGQQQRVALARTLAPRPGLVLLDEPFSNFDAVRRVETRQEIRALLKRAGAAAILVTHDREEAMAIADRIAVMEAGRLVQTDTPQSVYRVPTSEFVARFLGGSNIIEGRGAGSIADTPIGSVKLDRNAEGPVRLALRPEQIQLSPNNSEADQPMTGVVVAREFRGHDQVCWVHSGIVDLEVLIDGAIEVVEGQRVNIATREPAVVLGAPDACV